MKCMTLAVVATLLLLSAGVAQAAKKNDVFVPGKPLAEQIQRIEGEMGDGKTYAELKLEDRSRVREALGRMRITLERFPDESGIPAVAKTDLFNDQQIVNTLLTQAREDSRLICRREKATGSNFAVTQCLTLAQRERNKNDAQQRMNNAQRVGNFDNF
ncbi:hypothetical protein GQ674_14840 [Stenotrophomonas sp. 364]|jgi:Spy/CpxP family protein refolding chaperone|nr:hypothetical protein GQ674_14840 [Stenotrophomonas sp. 364]